MESSIRSFQVPTKIWAGENALAQLKEMPIRRACIICDPFVEKSGMLRPLLAVLGEMGARHRIFSGVRPDPDIALVAQGLRAMMDHRPDAVFAVGGGSAIDAAKAIAFFYVRTQEAEPPLFVAVPTTSGTGSEATDFAVITDEDTHIKYPLVDDRLLPDIAILDPSLVRSVPPAVTADTGMDVITHAIEAYVSTQAGDFSDALAEKALKLAAKYLPAAYRNGSDGEARRHMHNASAMAGVAFNHASLGINHSIAHIIGARFGISHGRANAILLPTVTAFNAGLLGPAVTGSRPACRYAQLGGLLTGEGGGQRQAVRRLIAWMEEMRARLDIPATLRAAGVEEDAFRNSIPEMAEIALQDRCTPTNPRPVTTEGIALVMEVAYNGR